MLTHLSTLFHAGWQCQHTSTSSASLTAPTALHGATLPMAGGQACLLPATASSRSSTALQGTLLAILLIASVQSTLAALTVESAGVRIVAPPGYRSRIDWALADFGEPKYGGLMLGRAVYLTEDAEYYAPATTRRPKCPGMMEAQYACVPYEVRTRCQLCCAGPAARLLLRSAVCAAPDALRLY